MLLASQERYVVEGGYVATFGATHFVTRRLARRLARRARRARRLARRARRARRALCEKQCKKHSTICVLYFFQNSNTNPIVLQLFIGNACKRTDLFTGLAESAVASSHRMHRT